VATRRSANLSTNGGGSPNLSGDLIAINLRIESATEWRVQRIEEAADPLPDGVGRRSQAVPYADLRRIVATIGVAASRLAATLGAMGLNIFSTTGKIGFVELCSGN
jgi:hypothetical protein